MVVDRNKDKKVEQNEYEDRNPNERSMVHNEKEEKYKKKERDKQKLTRTNDDTQ